MVFYLKYRPQKLSELDSDNVREKISSALSGNSVPHAFLFTGPKGLGKTSTARIVAKALNCERLVDQSLEVSSKRKKLSSNDSSLATDIEPCNKCSQCISITNGSNIDVLEIDGASNRGIDEIRDLREKIRLSPARASKKVYIIDEVHMLTTEAFNALLKTLEEPPSHAMFIFCTTEPHKVPATILSRCFHIAFKRATDKELISSFERIVKGEGLKMDDDILEYIAKLSDGSFRDGAKILEELVFQSGGKKITKDLLEGKYQISGINHQVSEMLKQLSQKNTKEAIKLIGELVKQGIDVRYFIEQLISELHQVLLVEVGVQKREVRSEKWEMGIEEIKKLVEILSKSYSELKYAVLPQLPLELAVLEFCVTAQNLAERHAEKREEEIQHNSASNSALFSDKKVQVEKKGDNKLPVFQELIEKVKTHNHSVAGVLRGCSLKSYDGKELIIETAYKFHKERLDDKKAMEILEGAAKEIAGNKINVSVILRSIKPA